MPPALALTDVSFAYSGTNNVLDSVSLKLAAGEIRALVGENGAGKSTLVRLISGDYPLQQGRLEIEGQFAFFEHPIDALQAGISIIHQELELVEVLSVAENLFLGGELKKSGLPGLVDFYRQNEESARLLATVGLDVDPRTPVSHLSLPEKQLVEILRAFNRRSKIIILDEPTSALSVRDAARVLKHITTVRDSLGLAFLYITHRFEELDVCDTVSVLRDGKMVYDGQLPERPRLVEYMTGRTARKALPSASKMNGKTDHGVNSVNTPDQNSPAALELKNYCCGVIEDLNVRFEPGTITALTGLGDSGIFDLPRALYGLTETAVQPRPDAGLYLSGRQVSFDSPAGALQAGLAFLGEDRKADGLCLHLSGQANLTLASPQAVLQRGIINSAREAQLAEEARQNMNIKWPSATAAVSLLSGGNQQKVLLSRWLLARPSVLILSEPTRGIDVGAREEIYDHINTWAGQGMCIIVISSDIEEILQLGRRVILFKDGRLLEEKPAGQYSYSEILEKAF